MVDDKDDDVVDDKADGNGYNNCDNKRATSSERTIGNPVDIDSDTDPDMPELVDAFGGLEMASVAPVAQHLDNTVRESKNKDLNLLLPNHCHDLVDAFPDHYDLVDDKDDDIVDDTADDNGGNNGDNNGDNNDEVDDMGHNKRKIGDVGDDKVGYSGLNKCCKADVNGETVNNHEPSADVSQRRFTARCCVCGDMPVGPTTHAYVASSRLMPCAVCHICWVHEACSRVDWEWCEWGEFPCCGCCVEDTHWE